MRNAASISAKPPHSSSAEPEDRQNSALRATQRAGAFGVRRAERVVAVTHARVRACMDGRVVGCAHLLESIRATRRIDTLEGLVGEGRCDVGRHPPRASHGTTRH